MKARLLLSLLAYVITTTGGAAGQDAAAPAENADAEANPVVRMKTSLGEIVIELDRAKAPVTVENFIKYVEDKFYDGTIFHRVIDGFMIQGGGFGKNGDEIAEKETRSPIKNEANNGLKNSRGTLAMARTSDPNSATAQFFINVADNNRLDHPSLDGYGYAVFGKVIEGMDVVDKIKAADTGVRNVKSRAPSGQLISVPMRDVPTEDVVIESAVVGAATEQEPAAATAPAEEPAAPETPAEPAEGDNPAETESGE